MSEECKHENTEKCYGYAHGQPGIGGYLLCNECGELIDYCLDYEAATSDEINWFEKSNWSKK